MVKTFNPRDIGPDALLVVGHTVDRVDVSLSRAFRVLATVRRRLEGSAQAAKEFGLCFAVPGMPIIVACLGDFGDRRTVPFLCA